MDDGGLSITGLTVGGAALTAIGGMVGAWIRARYGRHEITPQPLEVRAALQPIDRAACNEYRAVNAADHSNLFARMSSAEQRIAAAEAALHAMTERLASMDSKLDKIIGEAIVKPDITLCKHTLGILNRIGPAGLEETALMTEMEVAHGRPLTTAAARDCLVYLADKGWTGSRRDDFDRTIHWIREAGKTILAGM